MNLFCNINEVQQRQQKSSVVRHEEIQAKEAKQ